MTNPTGGTPPAPNAPNTPPPPQPQHQRPSNPQSQPSRLNQQQNRGRFDDLKSKLPANWWAYAVGLVALLLGWGYYQFFGMPVFSTGSAAMSFPGMPGVAILVTLVAVTLAIDSVLGLFEAKSREDNFLLDWWIPYVFAGVLVYGQIYDHDTMIWGIAFGVAATALVFAALWNQSEQDEVELWNRIDTTPIFRACFILILLSLAKWESVPYPAFVPVPLVAIVGLLSIAKEMMRTPVFALVVVVLGAFAAVFFNPLAIFGSLSVALLLANWGGRQGWIPNESQRKIPTEVNVMGRKMTFIMAWDVIITWYATFSLISIVIYNNPVVVKIGGG